MRLIHFSKHDTLVVEPREQKPRTVKPQGLWVSDEDDYGWSHWTTAEEFCDTTQRHAFAIELDPAARVLLVETPEALRRLHQGIGTGDAYYPDWVALAARWQGLIITPYQWSLRLSEIDWYYPWDCASGCIWDPAAIASVTPLGLGAVRDA